MTTGVIMLKKSDNDFKESVCMPSTSRKKGKESNVVEGGHCREVLVVRTKLPRQGAQIHVECGTCLR